MSAASCTAIREALPWFVGGDLEPSHLDEVRAHLLDCVACRNAAASLQQGVARLQRLHDAAPAAVDDAFFASMHADIVGRVAAAAAVDEPLAQAMRRGRFQVRPWMPLAAAALVAFGFWLGHGGDGTVFDRPALQATPAALQDPIVVPWAGSRSEFELRPLGVEGPSAGAIERGERAGMMARSLLHDLVDEGIVPPRQTGNR